MAPWDDFDTIFHFNKNFAYDGKLIEQILSNRRALENQLFADRLLGFAGVKGVTKLYPPRSNADLRTLVTQVVSSELDIHHKQALIYYILKDCRTAGDAASQFSRRCHLPEKYRLFIEGLWNLDRLEFRRAVEYLTEPSIIPTFPDEILYVLILPYLPKHDDSLVMAYYLTASPPLATEKVQKAFYATLCRASITEAFYFTRNHEESLRSRYLSQLIEFVHMTEAGPLRGQRAMELIGLPFDDQEEEWFEHTLLDGSAKPLHGAKDTVMMRRLAAGKLGNLSANLESLGGTKIDGSFSKDDVNTETRADLSTRAVQQQARGPTALAPFLEEILLQTASPPKTNHLKSEKRDDIKNDLTAGKGRPEWIFSCYAPGRNAPKQLFGGPQREQSFEEMRLRHYEAAAIGRTEQAVQEAQVLFTESTQQMDVILRDIDGAVKYLVNGIHEHPNRIDITEGRTGPGASQGQGPSPFGQPSTFGQPAASAPGFGQPSGSGFGQPSTFGQPSAGPASGFGQPSTFGNPSTAGPTSGFGQPSVPGSNLAFGKPSAPSAGAPAFGQSSFGQPAFGQGAGTSAFGKASAANSPFAQISGQGQGIGGTTGFAQASSTVSPFAQTVQQQPQQQPASLGFHQPSAPQSSAFGQPSQAAAPFGQPQQQQPSGFGQPSTAASPFAAVAQPPTPSPFGQPSGGFAQQQQQQQQQQPSAPAPTASSGPPAIIKVEGPNELNPIPPLTGETMRHPTTKRLITWKGQPVKYLNDLPCYLHPQDRQTYVRIFFPDGPPDEASLRDAQAKPETYTPEVTEQYKFFVQNGYFKDGVIPSVPPKTEWASFDF
ncbi:hypothetical protein FE257_003222 [Aspergillus nanangensis]|uniref:ELYS-like domain-containing protein n=1 Tax=Aspergillus nanangensis TaxID=2582783 RepID=A0AAD4CSG6_ASPNN|nr:hypothetical protein FE257_003222 [Aspergillus nanangensis]